MIFKRTICLLAAALLPMPAMAQVRLEAEAYARARAQCGYRFQEQVRQRCPGSANAGAAGPACAAPLLTQQQSCLRRAEQSYVRALRREMRRRNY